MNTNAIRLTASHACTYLVDQNYDLHPERPQGFELKSPYFETREEAQAWAAQFPKSAKFVTTFITGRVEDGIRYYATTRGDLTSNKTTGAVNETAVKRYRSIIKVAERLGMTVIVETPYVNAYADRETFEANI